MRKPRVYIAGPYTKGVVAQNIAVACRAGDAICEAGGSPYVPHLNHLWDFVTKHDYEFWLALDFEWLAACDLMVRLPGESSGADREKVFAEKRGIPVVTLEQAIDMLRFFDRDRIIRRRRKTKNWNEKTHAEQLESAGPKMVDDEAP